MIIFLDLDGTIREPASGEQFPQHSRDFKKIEGAEEAIAAIPKGSLIFGISNQGGIAAGHKSLEECHEEMQFTFELFPQIDEICFCPDFKGAKVITVNHLTPKVAIDNSHVRPHLQGAFRKPNPGMILYEIELIGLHTSKLSECFMVGDRPEDKAAAHAAGIKFCPADIWRKKRNVLT